MSRHLQHFLTLVGDVGRDASRELARFRTIVTDPTDRDQIGDFPQFSRFCQRLLSTRFEPAVLNYSCTLFRSDFNFGAVRDILGKDFRLNAVIDLNWAATVFSDREAERILSVAQKKIDGKRRENDRYGRLRHEEMLFSAFAEALRWRIPFTTFVVGENVGPTVEDFEMIEASKTTLDELVNRAAETARYLPSTQRGFQEPEDE